MIISNLKQIKIGAVSVAFPAKSISVDEYKGIFGEAEIEKFKRTTGIYARRISGDNQTASDLAYAAAKSILAKKSIQGSEIDAVVFVTQCADYVKPATAYVLHHRLGCSKDCIAFDINLGCSGFTYGVYVLASLMMTSNIKNALLLLGDTEGKERVLDIALEEATLNTLLFGDAGAAVLLQKSQDAQDISCAFRSDGDGFKNIYDPVGWRHIEQKKHETHMDGMAVFSFAINEAPALIKEFLNEQGEQPSDYDCLALHQSNFSIMKQIIRRSGFTPEKVPVSIDEYANTSVVSVLTALVKRYAGEQEGAARILACCYGVGLSWGVLSFHIKKSDILPPVFTDEYFDDELKIQ